ncbi:hypothetical protein BRC93_12205 [Halobacteriales archaeon QS_5_70_15]|nr:MAG: hypothetical protein BRC93_12205 [Halobacteriales archaeon QS_5_70_15]
MVVTATLRRVATPPRPIRTRTSSVPSATGRRGWSPQTEAVRRELRAGDGEPLHCLDCGRQVVARRHGGNCLLCGSAAIVLESV